MRTGSSDFKDASIDAGITDWLSLPKGTHTVSLWNCLHDAEIVSIRSNLIGRSMTLSCGIEHLREFGKFEDGFEFIVSLGGVQSSRVLSYAIWPGGCNIPDGISVEEQRKIVAEYQAKWREETLSWVEFESKIGPKDEQVFDISNATLAFSSGNPAALKLCGHLNHATYHEVFLRFETLRISGSDGRSFGLEEFEQLGEKYWEAFRNRASVIR
jgi:hypothetical protein